jgi:hypothetical protein
VGGGAAPPHAGDPDVDDVGVDDVEGDARAGQRHGRDHHPAEGNPWDQRAIALPREESGPQHPREDVEQHRIREHDGGGDVGAVVKEERDAEPQQHEQVEVQEAKRPAWVEEGDQEEQAQGEPDVGGVHFLRDRAAVPARERVVELGAVPGAEEVSRAPVDDRLRDLAGVRLRAGEVAHLPAGAAPEDDRLHVGALLALVLHRGRAVRDGDGLARRDLEAGRHARQRMGALERRRELAAERRLRGEVLHRDGLRGRRDRERQRAEQRDQQVR